MDDRFEPNEPEMNDMPEASPAEVRSDEPQAPAPQRRRRRKRRQRPAWQRMLWKYWPPIRFGLIVLAGILLIWLVISSIGAMFGGDTTPIETTEPTSETTEPTTAPTTEPTTEPTEPPTTAPTEPPDPFAGAVSDDWYDNTLFIGDFGVTGLRDSARAGNADYFCTSDMGVFNWDEVNVKDKNFEKQDLATLLASKTYNKVIISIGINSCGYPTSSLIKGYTSLINAVRNAQPEAKIILHSIMPVTKNYVKDRDYFTPGHISGVNDKIANLADGVQIFYISAAEYFTDPDGYLVTTASTDGYHLTGEAYQDWAKLIGVQLSKLDIE